MSADCSLCGLPVAPSPVTEGAVDGTFCCRGCLEVARAMGTVEATGGPAETGREGPGSVEGEEPLPDGHEEAFLEVDGMHCTSCETFLALRGRSRAGIHSVAASYATETARVRYDPDRVDASALPAALSGYGYEARFRGEGRTGPSRRERETGDRLLVGVLLAMFVMPWYGLVLYPRYLGLENGIMRVGTTSVAGRYLPVALAALFASAVVFYAGWPILRGALVSLRTRQPTMDLLLAVAVLSAYAYSTVALATGSLHLYYDVSVAIVLVVTAGRHYEGRVKRAATSRLADLVTMRVEEATRRLPGGGTETVDVGALEPGDVVVVRPGERVPVDGTVREGTAAVDEALLTGESLPTTKGPGDEVVGGSVVTDSPLEVTVGAGAESALDRLTSMVWAVQSDRPGVQRFADRLATAFVPLVLVLGVTVAGWRLAAGEPASAALLAGLTVLVVACPCAMGLATPLAVAAGLRDSLARGIVATNSALFEAAPRVETIVFDKTGTLTTGEMTVHEVAGDGSVLPAAAAVEERSSHPAARAIVAHAAPRPDGGSVDDPAGAAPGPGPDRDGGPPVTAFTRHPGRGVSARVDGQRVVVGTPALVEERAGPLDATLRDAVEAARSAGRLPVAVGCGGRAAAVVTVGDQPREGWEPVLEAFADRRVVVLTGDDEASATRYRDHTAVDDVFAGVPPDGKVATVERLRATGPTAMVGDGTNDAPALGVADVGIALAGTAHAADAADVVLVDASLAAVPAVFDLAAGTRRRLRENVGWALGYNAVAIPLAATGLLNPLLAALAMAASSLLVVSNSRRPLLRDRG